MAQLGMEQEPGFRMDVGRLLVLLAFPLLLTRTSHLLCAQFLCGTGTSLSSRAALGTSLAMARCLWKGTGQGETGVGTGLRHRKQLPKDI